MYVDFADAKGGTEVRVILRFATAEALQKVITEHGADKGLRENPEKLEEYLSAIELPNFTSIPQKWIVLRRSGGRFETLAETSATG